jgi:hypothetical protein
MIGFLLSALILSGAYALLLVLILRLVRWQFRGGILILWSCLYLVSFFALAKWFTLAD